MSRHAVALLLLSLCSTVCARGQTPAPISDHLRAHITDDRFQPVTSIRGLPLGVRDALGELIKGQYTDFAEPGAPFKATGANAVGDAWLPERRLVTAACANDHHCIVYYERGGDAPSWHAALFQWTPEETRLEFGGTAPPGLQTLDAVRSAMLSGAIKSASSGW